MEPTLKELRKQTNMSQAEAATFLNVPLRTYQNYENDPRKVDTIKYKYMSNLFKEHLRIDEDHGVLSLDKIKEVCQKVFSHYDIEYCYLFGSYAKGYANESSDVDLFISTPMADIRYFGMLEELSEGLHKRIEVLNQRQFENDSNFLVNEVMKDGIKIYG
ncbi:MAG: nucleotidyltransferase domain-containing protein [Coprobacillus sp.]|nr:nucleotidyltransferase domain-containing protein [Coprobacillus sp.]